jgi:hypothetical protein
VSEATGATVMRKSGKWQQLAVEAEITDQAPYVRVALVRNDNGAVWFDDVLVELLE